MLTSTTITLAMLLGLGLALLASMANAGAGAGAAAAAAGGGSPSFADAAGAAFDAADAAGNDDDDDAGGGAAAGDGAGAAADPGGAPPADKPKPADPAAAAPKPDAPAAPAGPTAEQLQSYQAELTAYRDNLQRIVDDPIFKEAYEAAKAKAAGGPAGQGGGNASPGASQADQPAAAAKKPWEGFNPETDNEKALVGFLDQMQSQFNEQVAKLQQGYDQRLQKAEEQLGTVSSRSESVLTEKAQQTVDSALGELKKEFPDLVDAGAKQKELEEEAGSQLMAAAHRGQRMTVLESLKRAAKVIGWDGHEERTRQKLQKRAHASAGARVDAPGGHDGDAEPGQGIEGRLGSAYDNAAGG